jgi:tetratricopeptide (TPR) repeat protein
VQPTRGGRYQLHELLRQYAAEKLAQDRAAAEGVRDRHAAYYTAALAGWEMDLKGPRQREALLEMDLELDNIRAAWNRLADQCNVEQLSKAAPGLHAYCRGRLSAQEGEVAFQRAAERLRAAAKLGDADRGVIFQTLARVVSYQCRCAYNAGRGSQVACDLITEGLAAVEKARASGRDVRAEEACLWGWQGRVEYWLGCPEVRRSAVRCLALYREIGDRWGEAEALILLSWVHAFAAEYGQVRKDLAEAVSICREHGDTRELGWATVGLTRVEAGEGRLGEAEKLAREVLDTGLKLGDPEIALHGLGLLAGVSVLAGRYADVLLLLEDYMQRCRELGFGHSSGAMYRVGEAELHLGRYDRARAYLQIAADRRWEVSVIGVRADALLTLGQLLARDGELDEARRLIRESITVSEACGYREGGLRARSTLPCVIQTPLDLQQARRSVLQALRWTADHGNFPVLVNLLPGAAMLLLREGPIERAVEVYELARTFPHVANSQWYADVVGHPIAQAATASLPPEEVVAAKERGRARDVQATLDELIAEWDARTGGPAEEAHSGERQS